MTDVEQIVLDSEVEEVMRTIRLVVFDFDGVFTDNAVYVSEDGNETVRCNRSDGLGLRKLEQAGCAIQVISTEKNPVVSVRCRKLDIPCVQGCDDKESVLRDLAKQKSIPLQEIAFVGNDINDAACLRIVGLPVVVRDAHPEVVSISTYQTLAHGGQGAVREVCDLLARVKRERTP